MAESQNALIIFRLQEEVRSLKAEVARLQDLQLGGSGVGVKPLIAYYCGEPDCYYDYGCWLPDGRDAKGQALSPWTSNLMRSKGYPVCYRECQEAHDPRPPRTRYYQDTQGQWKVVYKEGWTMLVGMDQRGGQRGAVSAFVFSERFTRDQAWAATRKYFPHILQQIDAFLRQIGRRSDSPLDYQG